MKVKADHLKKIEKLVGDLKNSNNENEVLYVIGKIEDTLTIYRSELFGGMGNFDNDDEDEEENDTQDVNDAINEALQARIAAREAEQGIQTAIRGLNTDNSTTSAIRGL